MKLKINITRKGAIISLSVLIATLFVDLITKLLVINNMEIGQSIPLIKGVLNIKYITNEGAAFGMLADSRWVFMTVSALLILFLVALILLWGDAGPLFYVSVSMILGGGIGNMIDRIAYGAVIDFIDFCAFPKLWSWIFNGADSFVCVGAGLLILWYVLEEVENYKKTKAQAGESSDENDGSREG